MLHCYTRHDSVKQHCLSLAHSKRYPHPIPATLRSNELTVLLGIDEIGNLVLLSVSYFKNGLMILTLILRSVHSPEMKMNNAHNVLLDEDYVYFKNKYLFI